MITENYTDNQINVDSINAWLQNADHDLKLAELIYNTELVASKPN